MSSRGLRNHNPGNIELGTDWDGLSELQSDPRFCQFDDPVYGIRAMVRILKTYQKRYGINTIFQAIARWAPPYENDTLGDATYVADQAGIDKDTLVEMPSVGMLKGMSKMENGEQPYTDEQIEKGISLA